MLGSPVVRLEATEKSEPSIDMVRGHEEEILMQQYPDLEYSLVLYYRSTDPKSAKMNELMDGAKEKFEQMVDSEQRKVGWLSVDVVRHNLVRDSIGINARMFVIPKEGNGRHIELDELIGPHKELNEKKIAELLMELTGDFVREITCEEIRDESGDLVVYFGPEMEVAFDREAEAVL